MSEREDKADRRQQAVEDSQKSAQKNQHHFQHRVAVLVSLVAVGCTLSLYQINHIAEERSDRNSCALNSYVQLQEERLSDLKLPGYKAQIQDLRELQNRLRPPTEDCNKVFPHPQ